MLDTLVAAETPEGIVLELHPAGLPVRCYAFLLDWLLRLAILYGYAIVARLMGGLGVGTWLILMFLLEWLYPVAFELGRAGATPGKKVFGLRVVMENGLPVTPAASFIRNLLRVADFLPFAYGLAIVSLLVRKDCKRLGDIGAATLVVHAPQAAPRIIPDKVEPVPPARPLTPRGQAALLALATRAPALNTDRLDELAAIAGAVSGNGGQSGSTVTRRVLGVAQWLMGRRS